MASGSAKVKLLGARQSPFVLRARIALNIKSVEYEYLEEHFPAKSELLLKSNPVLKKVPVLIHDDIPICESLVILQYIDEAWSHSPQILPSHPYDRAIARFWASYIDEKWFASVRGIILTEGEELKKKVEDAMEGASLIEDAFVSISKGGKFFGGESIGYLDIAIGCFLKWLDAIDVMSGLKLIDEIKTPNLFNWAQDFSTHPAVKDLFPQTEELVEFAKFLIARFKAPAKN